MATKDDPTSKAEEKLNAAEAALLADIESKGHDSSLLEFLVRNVDRAIADYQRLVRQKRDVLYHAPNGRDADPPLLTRGSGGALCVISQG